MKGKVFGIGLSRTGTNSLHKLLVELGYVSKHSSGRLIADNNADVMSECDALSDSPVPMLYRELDRRYPHSKFILTTRNKEAWLTSMKWMFSHGKVGWDWSKAIHAYHEKFYGTRKFDRAILSNHFDAFHEQVNAYFRDRPGDLLVIHLDQGFDTPVICDFLGIPRQDVQAPRTNQRRSVSMLARLGYWLKEVRGLR